MRPTGIIVSFDFGVIDEKGIAISPLNTILKLSQNFAVIA
jgi:hypothetical protein